VENLGGRNRTTVGRNSGLERERRKRTILVSGEEKRRKPNMVVGKRGKHRRPAFYIKKKKGEEKKRASRAGGAGKKKSTKKGCGRLNVIRQGSMEKNQPGSRLTAIGLNQTWKKKKKEPQCDVHRATKREIVRKKKGAGLQERAEDIKPDSLKSRRRLCGGDEGKPINQKRL